MDNKAREQMLGRLEGILSSNLRTQDWMLVWSSVELEGAGMLSGESMRDALKKAEFVGFSIGGHVPSIRTRLEIAGQVPQDMTNSEADELVARDITFAFLTGMKGGMKAAHDAKAGIKI